MRQGEASHHICDAAEKEIKCLAKVDTIADGAVHQEVMALMAACVSKMESEVRSGGNGEVPVCHLMSRHPRHDIRVDGVIVEVIPKSGYRETV